MQYGWVSRQTIPTMLHYKTLLGSMYNTPPCWSIYMAGLVFAKLLDEGGLNAVRRRNESKAKVCAAAIRLHTPQDAPSRQPTQTSSCSMAALLCNIMTCGDSLRALGLSGACEVGIQYLALQSKEAEQVLS